MPNKISDFFKSVSKKPLRMEVEVEVKQYKVIISNIKNEIQRGKFKNIEIIENRLFKQLMHENRKKLVIKNEEICVNGNKELFCKICNKTYTTKGVLRQHMKTQHPGSFENIFNCKNCIRKFLSKKALEKHMKLKHNNVSPQTFECDMCGKIFRNKYVMQKHLSAHLPNVKCKICKTELKSSSLYNHMTNFHAKDEKFQCKICHKAFKSISLLKLHEKCHNKKFECEICKKMFTTNGQLNMHKKDFHLNPRNFSCEICGKKFSQKGNMKSHQKTHERNRKKAFQCERCDYSTDRTPCIRNHMAAHRRQDEKFATMKNPLKCKECPTLCQNRLALKNHMKNVHPTELYQCDLCGKYIKTKPQIVAHIRCHMKIRMLENQEV